MKPVEFPEQNVTFAEHQPEYLDLPAFVDHTDERHPVLTCWELSAEELAEIMETGRVWVTLLTFGKPLQPIMLTSSPPLKVDTPPESLI